MMYNDLLKYPNVVGAGVGIKRTLNRKAGEAIVVMVTKKLPLTALSARDVIPAEAYGFATDVIEVGRLRAHSDNSGRWRPCPGGVSVGHYKISAGTLGCWVRDANGKWCILSNNHILANCNDAEIGDPIVQPGPIDGGTRDDIVAVLSDYEMMIFSASPSQCPWANSAVKVLDRVSGLLRSKQRFSVSEVQPSINLVDAAIAAAVDDKYVEPSILNIGTISGWIKPELGMKVAKSGRSTGLMRHEIIVLDATVTIDYDQGRSAWFEKQIVTGPMSAPGDSGSLLVTESQDDKPLAVGLLFAGSESATIHNPIETVMDRFGFRFE